MESILSLVNLKYLVNSVVYSLVGIVVMVIASFILDKATPGQFWKEILDEHNTALAILAGSMALGIALIIAASVHGG